jgi:transcription termination factor Rho
MSKKKSKNPEFRGMLEFIGDKNFGFIRELRHDLRKGDSDPFCSPPVIRKNNLRDGVVLDGTLKPGRKGDMQVDQVHKIMDVEPKNWATTRDFDNGQIIYPNEKLNLVTGSDDVDMRVVDLVAPLGKGQRALIVAPPRTGKTVLLKEIAAGVSKNHEEVELVCLLVDERPEEVTDFKRSTKAQVFASSNDRGDDNHVRVSTLALEYAKRLVELKKDVVLLLDSLTRLGRTFNLFVNGSGRTLSGGLDANALKVPRRIFGAARNIEGGGSLTIIATALIETGSRMDDVIFEEFKGTGNSEIVLDREMADKRIFPAVNLRKSGTRNEELLIDEEQLPAHNRLMRALNSRPPLEAMKALLRHLKQSESNEEMLASLLANVMDG